MATVTDDRRPLTERVPAWYAGGAFAALVAWRVLGDVWWVQPLTLTTFWWSLPGVVLVVVALVRRRWRAAALLAVPALVWVWSYGTLFLPPDQADAEPTLRIASLNTYVKAKGIDHVLALVEEEQPDILLLQEVFPSRQDRLVEALADTYPTQVGVQSPGVGGVAVLSRYPLVEQRPVTAVDDDMRDTAVAVLDVDGVQVQVVSVHLTSPCPSCGTSFTERMDDEGRRRRAELATVLESLRPGLPTIVGGDFNSTERSEPYRLLTSAGFEDPHRGAGYGPGFTWPNDRLPFPVLRIDWILTRGFDAVGAWVGDGGASDHRPVVADLVLRP